MTDTARPSRAERGAGVCVHAIGELVATADTLRDLLSVAPAVAGLDSPSRLQEAFDDAASNLSPAQRVEAVRLLNEMLEADHRHDDGSDHSDDPPEDDRPTPTLAPAATAGETTPAPAATAGEVTPAPVAKRQIDPSIFDVVNTMGRLIFLDVHSPAKLPIFLRSLITDMVAALEQCIKHLHEAYYTAHPEAITAAVDLSLSDLHEFTTIDEAVAEVISRAGDAFMWQSFEDWEKWFASRMNVRFADCYLDRERLIEGIQRRHLFAHSDGRVTTLYRQKIGPSAPPVGTSLPLDEDYVRDILDQALVFGATLCSAVWAKLMPEANHGAYHHLVELSMALMIADRWHAVEGLSRRGRELKLFADASGSLVYQVNEWLALKRQSGVGTIRDDVVAWDTSALIMTFRIARAALLDDFPALDDLVPAALDAGTLDMIHLHKWPLFAEYRATPTYLRLTQAHEPWRLDSTAESEEAS